MPALQPEVTKDERAIAGQAALRPLPLAGMAIGTGLRLPRAGYEPDGGLNTSSHGQPTSSRAAWFAAARRGESGSLMYDGRKEPRHGSVFPQ